MKSHKQFKKHYYNNGKIQRKFIEGMQPEGWIRGMLPRSKEHSEKIKASRLKNGGYHAWNKGMKCPMSAEARLKMLEARNKTMVKNGTRYGHKKYHVPWNKNRKHPYDDEVVKRISTTLKERYRSGDLISPTLGKIYDEEHRRKLSEAHLGKYLEPDVREQANKKKI